MTEEENFKTYVQTHSNLCKLWKSKITGKYYVQSLLGAYYEIYMDETTWKPTTNPHPRRFIRR